MAVKDGTGYNNLYKKLKRRERRIVKLLETIASLKRYITKLNNRSNSRKYRNAIYLRRAEEAEAKNKDILKFIHQPINKSSYSIMELMLRTRLVERQVDNELNHTELLILLYLSNTESSSTGKMIKDMNIDPRYMYKYIMNLAKEDYLVSNKFGNTNYVYITELGRRAVKTFIDLVTKQEFDIFKNK